MDFWHIEEKLRMKLIEVVANIKTIYFIEISECRAFKIWKFERKVVEGDSSEQYSLLWSYSVEFRRTSIGNTCNLERLCSDLQSRF